MLKTSILDQNKNSDSRPAKAPEDKAQAAVWVQADGNLSGRVKLTLQLDGAAEGTGGCVRHLQETDRENLILKSRAWISSSSSYW